MDEVLAVRLGDEWLELGSGKSVDESCFGDNKQQNLSAGEDGQLVGLRTCQRWLELARRDEGSGRRVGLPCACGRDTDASRGRVATYLLHDAGLSLGEGNVST